MPPRATTKHDVALAEVSRKANREAILAQGLVLVLGIAATSLPLLALQDIVEPLAGERTVVDVDVVVSVTLAASLVVNGLQWLKGRGRRRSLQEQRDRLAKLEGREP